MVMVVVMVMVVWDNHGLFECYIRNVRSLDLLFIELFIMIKISLFFLIDRLIFIRVKADEFLFWTTK